MSAIVSEDYYFNTYQGGEADEAVFPALCAHAERMIGTITHWAVNESNFSGLPGMIQTMYRLAVCSQIDFLALNGLEALQGMAGGNGGFTVGKVTVHGKAATAAGGVLRDGISPAAIAYLEQTGLMNPQVPTFGSIGSPRG